MNRRNFISALLIALPLHVAAAAGPITWNGKPLTEVRSMSELPPRIRAGFNMDAPTPAGVADIGKPFNSGDVIISGWPSRGLVGAGRNGETWIVVIAEGRNMGGTAVIAYVLEGTTLTRQERVADWVGPDAFSKIVARLSEPPRPRAELGGVSIDDSQPRVESVLGKPLEIIAHEQTYIGNLANKPANLMVTKELRYPGLSIWLRDGIGVMQISATGSGYCQTGRICPGATAAAVEDELRTLGLSDVGPNTHSYSLRHESRSCQADISFASATVSTIKVWCPL